MKALVKREAREGLWLMDNPARRRKGLAQLGFALEPGDAAPAQAKRELMP